MNYYISKTIQEKDFAKSREKVVEALKTEGFGVLTEIDIQATMKNKLDKEYLPYTILGACNPVFADKVLQEEPHIGALLPCNVILREINNGNIEVAIMDPVSAMSMVSNEKVASLAKEVKEMLQRVLDSV